MNAAINLLIPVLMLAGAYFIGGWYGLATVVALYLAISWWLLGRRRRGQWPFSGHYEPGRHDPLTHATERRRPTVVETPAKTELVEDRNMANLVRPTSSVDDVTHFEAGTTHESSFSDLDALRRSNNRTRWARTPIPLPAWSHFLHRPDMLIVAYKTTGRSKQAEVIDVAAIDITGEIRFRALTLPVGGITREAVRIHKLTQERLESEGALAWPEVHSSLLAVLSEAHRLLAWDAGFHMRLLQQTADRHGLAMPQLRWRDVQMDYWEICSEGQLRLKDAVEREGIDEHEATRALGDCQAVLAVMRSVVSQWKKS